MAIALITPGCGSDTDGADSTERLPTLEDFPDGWEVLEEHREDDFPYEQVIADCVQSNAPVEEVIGVGSAYGHLDEDGLAERIVSPLVVRFQDADAAVNAFASLGTAAFTECLDDAAASDPLDAVPFYPGTFTYVGAEMTEHETLDTRVEAIDEANLIAIDFHVEPMPDGPEVYAFPYTIYALRAGPLVQATLVYDQSGEDASPILDALVSAF